MGRIRSRVGAKLREVGLIHSAGFTPTQQAEMRELVEELRKLLEQAPREPEPNVLDVYCAEPPSPQTALDIFAGEWASAFPEPMAHVRAGTAQLFQAEHVRWGVEVLGGVEGQRVVEIGPLEGGHTYMLDRMGAGRVVAIEANIRAYLKCLVSKELLEIASARFLCGDAIRYLEGELAHGRPKFDLCLASGVLYHLINPVAALDLMMRSSDRLLLWTMYYDEDVIQSRADLAVKFPESTPMEYAGYRHTLYRQEYQQALDFKGFCGGSAATSAWMTRADILGAIEYFGFEVVDVGFDHKDHPHGPAVCIAARRRST